MRTTHYYSIQIISLVESRIYLVQDDLNMIMGWSQIIQVFSTHFIAVLLLSVNVVSLFFDLQIRTLLTFQVQEFI